MTTLERLAQWRGAGTITDAQHDALAALVRKDRFSTFLELNAILYVGVLAFATGVAWTVKTYFTDLGDLTIVLSLTAILGLCFYYCFSRTLPYSSEEVESPNMAFDYVLYLGCVVFAIELTYFQTRFELLRDAWDYLVLLSAVVFFVFAYRFDNRFVLSLALSTLAGWFGIKLTRSGVGSSDVLRLSALAYGLLVTGLGAGLFQLGVKKHFLETYLHVAATAVFVALLSGVGERDLGLIYLTGLMVLGALSVAGGIRYRRFAFVGYGVVYPYLGISYKLVEQLNEATLALGYVVVSSVAVVVVLVYVARRFGREE